MLRKEAEKLFGKTQRSRRNPQMRRFRLDLFISQGWVIARSSKLMILQHILFIRVYK